MTKRTSAVSGWVRRPKIRRSGGAASHGAIQTLRSGPRHAPKQGEQGRAQPEERRRYHHEQEVLHHMDLEQQAGERLDRRHQRQADGRQSAEKCGGAAAVPARGSRRRSASQPRK